MKLDQLKSRGAFITGQPVRKTITWVHADPENGEEMTDTFDVFVRRLSFGDVERIYLAGTEGEQRSRSAALISARLLLGDNADERITYEDAYQLDPGLAAKFLEAIAQVGEPGAPTKN